MKYIIKHILIPKWAKILKFVLLIDSKTACKDSKWLTIYDMKYIIKHILIPKWAEKFKFALLISSNIVLNGNNTIQSHLRENQVVPLILSRRKIKTYMVRAVQMHIHGPGPRGPV